MEDNQIRELIVKLKISKTLIKMALPILYIGAMVEDDIIDDYCSISEKIHDIRYKFILR